MNRYGPITFSAFFLLMGFLPCQVLAASIKEKQAAIGYGCAAIGDYSTAMGYYTTAMGYGTIASGQLSIAMGAYTIAGGAYSLAGGRCMQLTYTADNTFVWGYSESAQSISTANAFLIFPAGTAGKVGIGTKSPDQILHIVGVNPRIWVEGSSGNPEVNFLNSGDSNEVRWALYKDSSNDDFRFYQNRNRMTIQSSTGYVGIATSDPHYQLEVEGDAAKTAGGATWINSSDERLKDITGEYNRGLDAIVSLRPVTFFYKEDNPRGLPTNEENIGFIAQEVQDVFPEAISEGKDGYLDFNMHPVNVALVNAVKELKDENKALKQEIIKIKAALGL